MTRIVTVSTFSRGGIRSVVENYIKSGLYSEYEHKWVSSHASSPQFINILIFLKSIILCVYYRLRGYSIFHIHMAMKGSFIRKAILTAILKTLGGKVILHLHGSEFKTFYSKFKFKYLVVKVFENANCVIVLSQHWFDFVKGIAVNADVRIINNYVEPIKNIEKTKVDDFVFLFLGAIGKRKGVFDLLSSFDNLYKKNSKVKLIIGGNDDQNILLKEIEKLDSSAAIDFKGWIGYEEKTNLMNNADCLVLPSYNEGLPMVILEAMSAKLAVIATPVGGIPEVISDNVNGLLVEPGDRCQLENAMDKIRNNSDRHLFTKKSYNIYRERFSPDIILPKLNAIYGELKNG